MFTPPLPGWLACAGFALKRVTDLLERLVPQARAEVWSSVWVWIQFLEEVNIKRPPAASSLMRLVFMDTIIGFWDDPHTRPSVESQGRIHEFLTAGWVSTFNFPYVASTLIPGVSRFVLSITDMGNATHVRELIAGSGGSNNDLASLIVKHLRKVIPRRDSVLTQNDGVALLAALKIAEYAPLSEFLASHGFVDVICTTLCALCGPEMTSRPLLLPLPLPPMVFEQLLIHLDVFPRMTRLKEALDGGILRAIVLSASRPIVADYQKHLQALLGSILPQGLVYHSVLTRLRAALDDAKPLTRNREFRNSVFFGMWQDFVRAATDRLDLLAKFDRGEIGQTRACGHIECTSPMKTDDDLMRCARCRSSFYCSKECQSQDWAAGHRKLCRSLLKREDELAYLSTEVKFLRTILNHDYAHARPDVAAKHTKALETHPDALCGVIFDYRQGPTGQIECGPLPADSELTRLFGARVERSGGRLELHVMVLNVGKARTEWLALPMRVGGETFGATH
ncbi:hypothetical protein FB45DRAFT_932473 [Roridomyces roridus]|uniref:MYND-type domain-containing protein n=1 Tax=Roridomyces roridus TaxID=1738132 RepID=A0AAD7BEK7_9AGAR|nr:hypothetical protein FB45DRAFT_932473 [Roridomyces roridus]